MRSLPALVDNKLDLRFWLLLWLLEIDSTEIVTKIISFALDSDAHLLHLSTQTRRHKKQIHLNMIAVFSRPA